MHAPRAVRVLRYSGRSAAQAPGSGSTGCGQSGMSAARIRKCARRTARKTVSWRRPNDQRARIPGEKGEDHVSLLNTEVDLLRRVPLFSGIEPSRLKLLAYTSDVVTYRE